MDTQKAVTLYLEPWQKRMIRDFARLRLKKISKIIIQPGKGGCPTSYKVLPDFMKREDWWIYLTDQQILRVQEELGLAAPVSVINITTEATKAGAVMFA